MTKIKKIDEMALVAERIPQKKENQYVITQIWVCEKAGDDGYYVNTAPVVGDDLKTLVKKTLEKEFKVFPATDREYRYVEYPDGELWVQYIDERGYVYQFCVSVVEPITKKDMHRNGIESDMVRDIVK
jgi:hypothetical protein